MRYIVDLETISKADLTKVGAANYAAHSSTQISVFGFKKLGGKKTHSIVNPAVQSKQNTREDIDAFVEFMSSVKTIICHNAAFEKVMIEKCFHFLPMNLSLECSLETIDTIRYIDTMILANVFRSPAGLDKATKFFKLSQEKDNKGSALMKKVCKIEEKKPKRMQTKTNWIPTDWVDIGSGYIRAGKEIYKVLDEYCKQDVRATEKLYLKLSSEEMMDELGSFFPFIKKGMKITEHMNTKGVKIDTKFLKVLKKHKKEIDNKITKLTQEKLNSESASSRVQILKFLKSQDYDIAKLGKHDIRQAVRKNKNKKLNEVLKEYAYLNKTSLNKITKAELTLTEDNRLIDMFKFAGAYATGRWTSFGFQLQNLPRPNISLEKVMEIREGKHKPSPEEVVSCIRALIIPDRKDCKLYVTDLSQIELRTSFHKSGYYEKIKQASEGVDLYSEMAEKITGKKVKKGSPERQTGKETMLAAQYGVGAAKFKERMLQNYDIEISLLKAQKIIELYRNKYKNIPKMWAKYGKEFKRIALRGDDYKVKIATGRILNYGKIENKTVKVGKEFKTGLCYFDGVRYKMLWGGSIFQHIIQAEARDIMLIKMWYMFKKGYDIRMTVHDEVIIQVPEDACKKKIDRDWAKSGAKTIKKLFPKLYIDSESIILDRYFNH